MNTKILATTGPNCESKEKIFAMVREGVDIARMNFSHCTEGEFMARTAFIKQANKKFKKNTKIFLDLQGPRIRVGKQSEEGKKIEEGRIYVFSHKPNGGNGNMIDIDDPYLHLDVKKGHPIYLTGGEMKLEVLNVKGDQIFARCVRGGTLFSRKGINIPQTQYKRGALTAKDIKDAKFGVKKNVDYIGLSFVQTADDILSLRKIVGPKIKIIAKIERAIALKNIDGIIEVSDGIVIARGDLGVEMPMEDLPIIQKNLVRHSHWHGKPVIVATQMMLSMVDHDQPTRAEVSDVANAVFERADAVWLSDETANGKYPIETIRMMKKIISRIDSHIHRSNYFDRDVRA